MAILHIDAGRKPVLEKFSPGTDVLALAVFDGELDRPALRVLAILIGMSRKDGSVSASREALADIAGISKKTVTNCLSILRARSYISGGLTHGRVARASPAPDCIPLEIVVHLSVGGAS